MILDKKKIVFSEASLVDDLGRVFFFEGRVFRAIYLHQQNHCRELLESNFVQELITGGLLVKTWITDYKLEGYSLVLEHEVIQESRPHHWSFGMFKDAALALLRINEICNKYDYELKDAHPYNIFFKNLSPIFIDFGSIVKRNGSKSWRAYNQFVNSFFIQLLFWERGDFFIARKLIEDGNRSAFRTIPMTPIENSSFLNIIRDDLFEFELLLKTKKSVIKTTTFSRTVSLFSKISNVISVFIFGRPILTYRKRLRPVNNAKDRIQKMRRPSAESNWGVYHNVYKKNGEIVSTLRFDRIIELVKNFASDARSITDLAGNQGVFCYLLYKKDIFKKIILTDYDERAIDTAFESFKNQNINIDVFLFNFMKPVRREECKILKSDIVFALAVTHHLLLGQNYSLSAIISQLKEYSNKYIILEFMPLGLWDGSKSSQELPTWYTLEWFRDELQQNLILVAEEKLELNRILFICKLENL